MFAHFTFYDYDNESIVSIWERYQELRRIESNHLDVRMKNEANEMLVE